MMCPFEGSPEVEGEGVGVPVHVPRDLVVGIDGYNPGDQFHEDYRQLQDRFPDIVWTTKNGGHWIALSADLINRCLTDYEYFSSEVAVVPLERNRETSLVLNTSNPPEHSIYRKPLNECIRSPRVVRELEGVISECVARTISNISQHGRCDFVTDFAEILPIEVFMHMVNLPLSEKNKIKYWVDVFFRPESIGQLQSVMADYSSYMKNIISDRKQCPGSDVISKIAQIRNDKEEIDEDDAVSISLLVMNGGMDTVVNFLSYVFEFLATHPNERRYLVENPDRIPMAVEEFLRRFGLVQLVRLVRKDLHFQGVCLKAGDLILLPTGAFGLDDRLYEEPLRVDFGRKRLGYATFGNGPHRCPGENLARTEVSIALTEWLSRIPDFEIDPERAVVKDGGIVACIKHLPIRWTVADPISAAA